MTTKISADLPGVTDPIILYHYQLGVFHGMWAALDVMIDFAIGQLLKLPHEEAHMVTWGMMFGPKAKLLSALIKRSDHPRKQQLQTALNAVRNDAKRDIVAHGYQIESEDVVAFLEKSRGGDFTAKFHIFSRMAFRDHVDKLVGDGNSFFAAVAADPHELDAFVEAAKSMANRRSTSPAEPTSSK